MKQSLHINLTNQLTLTPQLQQAIRLLQLSTLDLQQEIQQLLETNPLLEENSNESNEELGNDDAIGQEDEFDDFQWSNLYTRQNSTNRFNESDYIFESLHCTKENLQDHLLWQLDLTPMSDTDRVIAVAIVDAIDDDGFLTLPATEIHKSLNSDDYPLDLEEINAVLHRVQRLDPTGCGAENLAETLLIQLEHYPDSAPHLQLTKDIIANHLDLLGQHNYQQLKKIYRIDAATLRQVESNIHYLYPRPGRIIAQEQPEYVIPDLLVKKSNNKWQATLNLDTLPQLSINNEYASLIKRANNSMDNQFLKSNLQEARWFLKGIQNRQETLLKVAQYIVDFQQDFFELGEEAMKPLTLNEVADSLELHESTISRVTTQKYMYTPRGMLELKYFFSSHIATNSGDERSSIAIRALIKKSIMTENQQRPLSDSKLVALLAEQDIKIARRTVTKYREEMNIPPTYKRKRI